MLFIETSDYWLADNCIAYFLMSCQKIKISIKLVPIHEKYKKCHYLKFWDAKFWQTFSLWSYRSPKKGFFKLQLQNQTESLHNMVFWILFDLTCTRDGFSGWISKELKRMSENKFSLVVLVILRTKLQEWCHTTATSLKGDFDHSHFTHNCSLQFQFLQLAGQHTTISSTFWVTLSSLQSPNLTFLEGVLQGLLTVVLVWLI